MFQGIIVKKVIVFVAKCFIIIVQEFYKKILVGTNKVKGATKHVDMLKSIILFLRNHKKNIIN
jgi:hypothetical protein